MLLLHSHMLQLLVLRFKGTEAKEATHPMNWAQQERQVMFKLQFVQIAVFQLYNSAKTIRIQWKLLSLNLFSKLGIYAALKMCAVVVSHSSLVTLNCGKSSDTLQCPVSLNYDVLWARQSLSIFNL
jgi:hypothetical protein